MIGYQRFPPVTRISITARPNRLHHWHIIGISKVSEIYDRYMGHQFRGIKGTKYQASEVLEVHEIYHWYITDSQVSEVPSSNKDFHHSPIPTVFMI